MPQETLTDSRVGLNADKIDQRNQEEAVFRYIAKDKPIREAKMKDSKQHAIPAGTYAPAVALRKRILQLSLAPHITSNPKLKVKEPSRIG
jgi:hypothetical protein